MPTLVIIHTQATKPRNATDLRKSKREISASGEKGEVMVFSKKKNPATTDDFEVIQNSFQMGF